MNCNKHKRFSVCCADCRALLPEITKTEVKNDA